MSLPPSPEAFRKGSKGITRGNDEIIALYQMYVKDYQREYDIQANKFGKNRLTLKDDQIALNLASMKLSQTKSILNRLLQERENTKKENEIKLKEIENKKIIEKEKLKSEIVKPEIIATSGLIPLGILGILLLNSRGD